MRENGVGWEKVAGGKWVRELASRQTSYDPAALEKETAVSEKFNTRKQSLQYKSGLKP